MRLAYVSDLAEYRELSRRLVGQDVARWLEYQMQTCAAQIT